MNAIDTLSEEDRDRVIQMAWEDRTPFEAILFQFHLPERDVIRLMRSCLLPPAFRRWRKRVNQGISRKHLHKRPTAIKRFKCNRQRAVSSNRIAKRR